MRPFTLKTELVSIDKSSKIVDRITKSYNKMAKTVTAESKIAGNSYTSFTRRIGIGSKKVMVSMNTLNASVNRTFRGLSQKLGSLGLFVGFGAAVMVLKGAITKFADFEQANASLASVMADATEPELLALSNDAKRLGAITARSATEIVGLQEAFGRLGFAQKDTLNMTESTISGSIAMNGELSQTAELVGAMVRSFDDFESADAPKIIDQLTKSTQKSALNFEKLQTSLPIVAGAANAAGIPFTKLQALLGKLSDAGIDASSSATSLRNIFLESAKKGLSYNQILDKIVNSQDSLTAANDAFGKRAAVSGVVLAKKLSETAELEQEIINSTGAARKAADKQLNTLQGTVTILKSAWEGWILSLDDGNGKFSTFLKTSVKVATEMLSIATGTQKASGELNKAELRIRKLATRAIKFLKILKGIVLAFIAFKAVMIATKAIIIGYNLVLGIQSALFGTLTRSIIANSTSLGAYTVVSKLATAATWLFSAALWANPMTWVVAGIAALVAGIVMLITHWKEIVFWVKESDNWFAKLIRAAIYPLIIGFKAIKWAINGIIDMFKKLINWIKTSDNWFAKFARGGINGIKIAFQAVGDALKWVGDQFSKVWDWIKKIGGKALQPIKDVINFFSKETQKELGVNAKTENIVKTINEPQLVNKNNALINALDNNSKELDKNTNAGIDGWTGRFKTTILKDLNLNNGISNLTQRELATTAIGNENNNANIQSSVTPDEVVTQNTQPTKRRRTENGHITINVVDKTGGKFGLEVEGTGVNVMTTGNG